MTEDSQNRIYRCDECEREFETEQGLNIHASVHPNRSDGCEMPLSSGSACPQSVDQVVTIALHDGEIVHKAYCDAHAQLAARSDCFRGAL